MARRLSPCHSKTAHGSRPKLADLPADLLAKHQAVEAHRAAHRIHPHQLRHNAATAIRREFGIEAARIILGHETLTATQIYAEADLAKASAVMRQIG